MDYKDHFQNAVIKYRWAQTHLNILLETVSHYEKQYDVENVLEEGKINSIFRLKSPAPIELSLMLGDLMHNLRSILDYITCALVKYDEPSNELKTVQFPYGDPGVSLTERKFKERGIFSTATKQTIEKIRQDFYAELEILKDISNQDKHRILVPGMSNAIPVKFEKDKKTQKMTLVHDLSVPQEHYSQPLKDGDSLNHLSMLQFQYRFFAEKKGLSFSMHDIKSINDAIFSALNISSQSMHIPIFPDKE